MKPEFKIKILGKSSALPTRDSFPSSQLISFNNLNFLVDCGEACQIQLLRNKVSLLSIKHIFISHLHGDHYFGLFGLISSMNLLGRKNILHIYSHEKLESIIKFVMTQAGDDPGFSIIFHNLKYDNVYKLLENKNFEIYSFPLRHRIPTAGFLFKEKVEQLNIDPAAINDYSLNHLEIRRIKQGADLSRENKKIADNKDLTFEPHKSRSYAYCSDTAYNSQIIKILKNVDLMYHEATFAEDMKSDAEARFHSTGKQAGKIAKKSEAGKLLLGHFSNRYKDVSLIVEEAKQVFENTIAAKENENYII